LIRPKSIDHFYERIDGKIRTISAYLSDKAWNFITPACRLKPSSIFTNEFLFDNSFENSWIDEFGNILLIENKRAKIKYNQYKKELLSTDLFDNEPIKNKIKKGVLSCIGLGKDKFIIGIVGKDRYIRCLLYDQNGLRVCSPLLLGVKRLKAIARKNGNKFSCLGKDKARWAREIFSWFILPLPASDLFIPNIENYEELRKIIYEEKH